MNAMPDLGPASERLAGLLAGVTDDQLGAPTPCEQYTLGDLIEHVGGLALGFTLAAAKETGSGSSRPPSGDASRLADDWRTSIPKRLDAMAQAWREPAAWQGMTRIGGVDLPGEVAGVVGLNELVVHGWDVSQASGQPYDPDAAMIEACLGLVTSLAASGQSPFGPPVAVPADAPAIRRLIGLTGRDPAWAVSRG